MRLLWTVQATEQLRKARDCVLRHGSEASAERQIELILRAVEQLQEYPQSGRRGRVEGTRELIVHGTPYLAAYRVREESIRIVAVWHGARRWPRTFADGED